MRSLPSLSRIAERLMKQPAAPYHEKGVTAEVESICSEHGLEARRDRWGNMIVSVTNGAVLRPLVLAAHMDHPGFARFQRHSPGKYRADFLGGVADQYFRPGVRLRLHPGDRAAQLSRRIGPGRRFEIVTTDKVDVTPEFAVWDLEAFAVRDGKIHGRSCDDLIGVATILTVLIELKKMRRRCRVTGVISRAEEVGFQGALMVAAGKGIPRDALVISLETSRELPPVRMGQGVIIRVGDRSSVFDSEATRFLTEAAQAEAGKAGSKSDFLFQRALMSGGTCEGTAYQEAGYQTAAVCVALGNYHNCAEKEKIGAEFVSVRDAEGMVRLMVAAARQMPAYDKLVGRLPVSLRRLSKIARRELGR